MDEVAREVLKKLKPEIKRNLNLDDEILDTLEATDTLTSDHVEQIKAEKTNSGKISTLLSLLERRGPEAFQAFVDAIKTEYKHVADILLDKYEEEEQKLDKDSGNNSEESLELRESQSPESSNINHVLSPTSNVQSGFPNVSLNGGHKANRSQERDATNVHYPAERHSTTKHSNHIMDMTVYPTNHFLHYHSSSRRTSNHSIDFATHQSLNGMYTKLKMHLFHINEREQSFSSSPVPVNFEMVEDLLDKVLKMEKDCYKAIGASNKDSLLTNIINLKILKADLQKNMNKKEEQIQRYATKILKLENMCKNNDTKMKQQENTIETLRHKNKCLCEDNEKLREEVDRLKHDEENEEENQSTRTGFRQIKKQNEELQKRISKYEKEIEMLTLKFNTLKELTQSHPNVNQANHVDRSQANHENTTQADLGFHNETIIVNKKNKIDAAENRPKMNEKAGPASATLQECKEICAGTHSPIASDNWKPMKSNILFAEAKKSDSRKVKDPGEGKETCERMPYGDKTERHRVEGLDHNRRQYYGLSYVYDTSSKSVPNKHSVTQNSTLKQKFSLHIKKPVLYRGLKKNQKLKKKSHNI